MKYLFPYHLKRFGLLLFIPSVILGVFTVITSWEPEVLDVRIVWGRSAEVSKLANNLLNELLGILVIVSGLLVAFSKEKVENEFIEKVRLESLVWEVYTNYILLFLGILLLYDTDFFLFMTFNIFTILIFFIIRFKWQVSRLKREVKYEK